LHAGASLARRGTAALIAQLVEHLICNQGVSGSNPDGGTRFSNGDNGLGRCRRFHLVELKVINSCKLLLRSVG
jgi:hypothetical protein